MYTWSLSLKTSHGTYLTVPTFLPVRTSDNKLSRWFRPEVGWMTRHCDVALGLRMTCHWYIWTTICIQTEVDLTTGNWKRGKRTRGWGETTVFSLPGKANRFSPTLFLDGAVLCAPEGSLRKSLPASVLEAPPWGWTDSEISSCNHINLALCQQVSPGSVQGLLPNLWAITMCPQQSKTLLPIFPGNNGTSC